MYKLKSPFENIKLHKGDTVFIDVAPMDTDSNWGDFSASCIFKPITDYDYEKVKLLELIQSIQLEGIKQITAQTAASHVSSWYINRFQKEGITLLDARNTVGHSIHSGAKKHANGKDKRLFLEKSNNWTLNEGVFAIEPGGYKTSRSKNDILVGRFEECIYIPFTGKPIILGNYQLLPIII